MSFRRFLLPFLLLSAGVSHADLWNVQVLTADGSSVTGTLELGKLHLESDLGKFDVEAAQIAQVDIADSKAAVRLRDGSTLVGTINVPTWKVTSKLGELQIASDKVKRIGFLGPANPPVKPGVNPGATPEADPSQTAELKPDKIGSATLALVCRPALSADGARLFFLGSDGKFCALDTESMEVAASVDGPQGAVAFSVAPGGATAWVIAASAASVINTADFTVKKTFQVEHKMYDVIAIEGGLALAVCDAGLVVLDPQKQAALGARAGISGMMTRLEGQNRAWNSACVLTWALDSSQPGGVRITYTPRYSERISGLLTLTADARFAISRAGDLYRIGRSPLAACLPAGKVSANASGVGLKEKLLLFTQDGFLKIHEAATFELSKSIQVGVTGCAALADEKKGLLYVFCAKKGSPAPSWNGSSKPVASAMGSWYRYKVP